MGRTLPTMTYEVKEILKDWEKFMKASRNEDRKLVKEIIRKAQEHMPESSYLKDPLEAVILSVLVEIQRELEDLKTSR